MFTSSQADTGYDTTPGGRYYTVSTPGYASWVGNPAITAPSKTCQNWLGNTSGTFELDPNNTLMSLFGGGRTGPQQTGWYARDAKLMADYLQQVAEKGIGQPDYDWLPYLQQAQTEHQGAFGIPWTSDRSNPYAAVNSVLAKAGLSQYDIPPDVIARMTDIIQKTQESMGGLDINWGMVLATIMPALAPALAGAAAAEAGAGAAAGGVMAADVAAGMIPAMDLATMGLTAADLSAMGFGASEITAALGGPGATGAFDLGGMAGGVSGAGAPTGWTPAGGFPGVTPGTLETLLSGNPLKELGVPDWATSAGRNFARGMLTGQDPMRAAVGALLPPGIQMAGEYLPSMEDVSRCSARARSTKSVSRPTTWTRSSRTPIPRPFTRSSGADSIL